MKVFIVITNLIALANLIVFASASAFVAYASNHFAGADTSITRCGCSNIPYQGSYKWYHDGQSGNMFNKESCPGVPVATLPSNEDTDMLTGFGWKSIDIIC